VEQDFPKNQFARHYAELLGLPKGYQSCQSTTILHNECTHMFLYVFGHCGKYMLGLLLILISKSCGFSCTFVYWCRVCMYISWRLLELAHPKLTLLLLLLSRI
jgi:hypothetical protein